jgi:hypothetical protein
MKKYILILIPFIFWGCQKDFNSVLQPETGQYNVSDIGTANIFLYTHTDSLITISIELKNKSNINSVTCNITAPDNTVLNDAPVILYDNGNLSDNGDSLAADNRYSNKFPMSQSLIDGSYEIDYFVKGNDGSTTTVAKHFFTYDNGLNYPPPVVSDLSAPDTISVDPTDTTYILLTLKVQDNAGLSDIYYVFFNSFIPPDGNASKTNPVLMFDDGKKVHGDLVAGDGIYSQIVSLPPTGVPKGIFRWEFQAMNYNNKLSNKIIHYVVVK